MSLYDDAVAAVFRIRDATQARLDAAVVAARAKHYEELREALLSLVPPDDVLYPVMLLLATEIVIGRDTDNYPKYNLPPAVTRVFRAAVIAKYGCKPTGDDLPFTNGDELTALLRKGPEFFTFELQELVIDWQRADIAAWTDAANYAAVQPALERPAAVEIVEPTNVRELDLAK